MQDAPLPVVKVVLNFECPGWFCGILNCTLISRLSLLVGKDCLLRLSFSLVVYRSWRLFSRFARCHSGSFFLALFRALT